MANFVEYLLNEQLTLAAIVEQDKNKIIVADARGRRSSVPLDKILYRHHAVSLEELETRLKRQMAQVEVTLLWDMISAEEQKSGWTTAQLADLCFAQTEDLQQSAIFRALTEERLHFRRRGQFFETRSASDIEQMQNKQQNENRSAAELEELGHIFEKRNLEPDLAQRLLRYLRGQEDKILAAALEQSFKHPLAEAFMLLSEGMYVPPTMTLEVLQADLKEAFPGTVCAQAQSLSALAVPEAEVEACAFSIDDPETQEVDDALSLAREGELWRIDVDIADPSRYIEAGDLVDREALKRATTVYLPIGVYYMLPKEISCNLSSLTQGQARPALRTSVWLDDAAQVKRCEMRRIYTRVTERLSYEQVDEFLSSETDASSTAKTLRQLQLLAQKLAEQRSGKGAVSFNRREWKIRVSADAQQIEAKKLNSNSPSRALVAEMMILVNAQTASFAAAHQIPVIYRVQPSPEGEVPKVAPGDPGAFEKFRRLIKPAALSLHPGAHWGLGLDAYTQASSPLRRYADLVTQRQMGAVLEGKAPSYDGEALLKVLAAADSSEKEYKRLEQVTFEYWALEYAARLANKKSVLAHIVSEAPSGGYRVELDCCGAPGLLHDTQPRQIGDQVLVDIKTVKPRQGVLRVGTV